MHRLRYFVGLCTLVAVALGGLWIVRLLQSSDDGSGLQLTVEFKNAQGLRAGTDVRYRGVTVGAVRSVAISGDGSKAVAALRLDPAGAKHACVNSSFWVVRPRFGGLTAGASGLDTLVRDSYIAFHTPAPRGSALTSGTLLAGRERPPVGANPEVLDELQHGDLLMTLLVPQNHGLVPGSDVVFRGIKTGDVRSVQLAPSGTHVEVALRIERRHRQTVTDRTKFWVARPQVSGALFSGFTLTDVNALLTPYVSYYGEPGDGVLVQDGYRSVAEADRPSLEFGEVPDRVLRAGPSGAKPAADDVRLVRITYAAVERDTFSSDDPLLRHGTGVMFFDSSGRAVVVTARSLVDGSYTERELWGEPEIADEQIKALLPDGSVLRAGRVWVHAGGQNLAALVLEDAPPGLVGTPATRFDDGGAPDRSGGRLRVAGPDGHALPDIPYGDGFVARDEHLGGVVLAGERVVGVLTFRPDGDERTVMTLADLPEDLRPR